jgi:glycosyltransferase involved in cell wall biosynthesis
MFSDRVNPVSVSLVIPCFNRADLIKETIDSALHQTQPFTEIIIVDDGSTDNTAEVLELYGDLIKVVKLTKCGVQAARNAGVAEACGQYITFCDSDDLLEPEFVECASRWLNMHPSFNVFYCNFVTFDQKKIYPDKFSFAPPSFFNGSKQTGEFLYDIPDLYVRTVQFQPLFMSGCLICKAFYNSIGGFNTAFNNVGAEDWEFTLRAISTGKVAVCIRPLVRIRKHGGNDSHDSIRQVRGTAEILEYALIEHPHANQYRETILRSITYRRGIVFDAAFSSGRFDIASEMLELLLEKPNNLKFRLKVFIIQLPSLIRNSLWRITQWKISLNNKVS